MPIGLPHSTFLSWSVEDQDKALAYQREMAKACVRCGTRQDEWDANPNAYLGDIYHCEGCARLAQEEKNAEDLAPGAHIRLLPERMALERIERGQGGDR